MRGYIQYCRLLGFIFVVVVSVIGLYVSVSAVTFTGGSYKIDASVIGNSFGGDTTGGSYKLTSSGGESIVGQGTGGSYKLDSGYVAQLPKSLQLIVQPEGLMGYYPLEEATTATAYDRSANTVNAASVGTPTIVTGKIGSAWTFDGATAYSVIGTTSSMQGTQYTLEGWVKSTTSGTEMTVVSKSSNFWLGLNYGKAAIYDWTASTTCQTTTTYNDGNWHHLAATLSSGVSNGSIIYVDGVQQETCTWTPLNQTGYVAIGAAKAVAWQQFFNGQIDEVKIFNRAFTADEIKAEYDAQAAGIPSGLHLNTVMAGISNTALYDAIVQTDASSYNLAVNQNQNLTSGANSITGVSGSIASPVTWVEGTTKGLGFTLYGTNATAIDGKWSSGNAYAAFPGTSTTFYSRTGYTAGAKDYLKMRVRLDVPAAQVAGTYDNIITVVGTIIP